MSVHAFELVGSGGAPIRGDVWIPDHVAVGSPVVVGIHGFKGFRRWGFWPAIGTALNAGRRAAPGGERGPRPYEPSADGAAHAAGFALVSFDMSHNGVGRGGLDFDEPGRFEGNTWAREEEDLGVVLAALRGGRLPESGRVDTSRLALLGHSRGGGLAVVRAAGDAGVRAVVTLAPIASIQRFDEATLARARSSGFIPIVNTRTHETLRFGAAAVAELDSRPDLHDIATSHASHLAAPLLVVHGEADSAVDPREGRALVAAAPRGTYVGIAGADHVLGCRHPWAGTTPAFERFLDETTRFLRATLG